MIKKNITIKLKKIINILLRHKKIIYTAEKQYNVIKRENGEFLGKNVVVIGGSGAIGRAICLKFAIEGANVIVAGRTKKNVDKVIKDIEDLGYVAKSMIIDIEDEKSIEEAFSMIFDNDKEKINILVNCAGGGARDKANYIHEQSIKVIDTILNSNLRGTILCSREAAKRMVKQENGKIINISSAVGIRGMVKYSDYAAAKAGIIGYTASLALELAPYNINVNCISPGYIQRGEYTQDSIDYINKKCPMNKMGSLEDVANAVIFIASDESKYITGQNLIIDGGRTLGLYSEN